MSQAIFVTARILSRRFPKQTAMAVAKMSDIKVRCVPDEERMLISVNYNNKVFNLLRLKDEELGKTLGRLKLNISTFVNAKAKKKRKKEAAKSGGNMQEIENTIILTMINKGQELKEDMKNIDAWTNSSELLIGEQKLSVEMNVPAVASIILPKCVLAGFPIFPKYVSEFCNTKDCQFIWHRESQSDSNSKGKEEKSSVELSRDLFFTPTVNEIGHRIKLTIVPRNGDQEGKAESVTSKFEVEASPGICPFENRHLYTTQQSPVGSLRIVSYNILADLYADSDFSRTNLFSYCPPYALEYDYRKQLLLREISGYNSDIICLQEVDRKAFDRDLLPSFQMLNLSGLMREKSGQVSEGSALFYRNAKLRLLGQHDIALTEVLKTDEAYADIWQKITTLESLQNKMEERSTILQLAAFECLEKPDHVLCVANTHLYFRPTASHIRLIQTAVSIRHIESVVTNYQSQGKRVSFVFCGDFNSLPESEVNTFLTTKYIPADYPLWNSNGEEEKLTDLELHHNYNIISGCGYHDFTNYTVGFQGHLDYIFIDSDNLSVSQVIPMPTQEEIDAHIAIPSIVSPSDHIAQVCDIEWK